MRNNALVAQVTSFVGWTFLPAFLTRLALNGFYTLFPMQRPALPPNPTPQEVKRENDRANLHARVARGSLVAAYLIYTIASVYFAQSQIESVNYYAFLGLPKEAVDEGGASLVKSHWRRLARVYHPDKVGSQGEGLFVALRHAVECLSHDEKRWAYDRFGPAVMDWQKLVTRVEFVRAGMQGVVVFYVLTFVTLLFVTVFRVDQQPYIHARARLMLLLCTLAIELSLTVQGSQPLILRIFFPNRLPYEHVSLVRQMFISSSLALSHIGPLLEPSDSDPSVVAERALADLRALEPLLARIAQTSEALANESLALQRVQVDQFVPKETDDEATLERKKRQMTAFQRRLRDTVQQVQVRNGQTAEASETRSLPSDETEEAISAVVGSQAEDDKVQTSDQTADEPKIVPPLEPESTTSAPPEEKVEAVKAVSEKTEKPAEKKPDQIEKARDEKQALS